MTGRIAVLAFLTMGLGACSLPHDIKTVAGTYVMHLDVNADTIVLRSDGRYVRTFKADGEKLVVDSGAWFVTKNQKVVALRNFPKRWPWIHDCMGMTMEKCTALLAKPEATFSLSIERSWRGQYRLGWHSSFNWYYSRIKDEQ